MAEFGAKLCSDPGCRQHDFLPWTCSACGRVFCQEHMAIGSGHRCDSGEAYLASVRVAVCFVGTRDAYYHKMQADMFIYARINLFYINLGLFLSSYAPASTPIGVVYFVTRCYCCMHE